MFYVDSTRTTTRRDSSLISRRQDSLGSESDFGLIPFSLAHRAPPAHPSYRTSESGASQQVRPPGAIREELVTTLFESMLDTIIVSWKTIEVIKPTTSAVLNKVPSEAGSKKKGGKYVKPTLSQKIEEYGGSGDQIVVVPVVDPLTISWWSAPDERAIVRFRNGNIYEGMISKKCMHGEGRFQWTDGTIYMGKFEKNVISGRGKIEWKDESWYEGDFSGNIRHGNGLYVNCHQEVSYCGLWHNGTKHGTGTMYYNNHSDIYHEGEWVQNVRQGVGTLKNCNSGYKGMWDYYLRDGIGMMIWPNHDVYIGEWKNNKMSGSGKYVWDTIHNDSMSLPVLSFYNGQWLKGKRDGVGTIEFGTGCSYQGQFKDNVKHGAGKLISSNGFIATDKCLFLQDIFNGRLLMGMQMYYDYNATNAEEAIPCSFEVGSDVSIDLHYHIQKAMINIKNETENRSKIIKDFLEINDCLTPRGPSCDQKKLQSIDAELEMLDLQEFMEYEKISLRRVIRRYQSDLRNIYYKYATICNTSQIFFNPVMIRLFLWQFYYDCDIHEEGLNLVEIDKMLHDNEEWLSKQPHDPFEAIQFWQFLQSIIFVAIKLYCRKGYPGVKPDTLLASAFCTFMEEDAIPAYYNIYNAKGRLTKEGLWLPLRRLYELYQAIGDDDDDVPTVRQFLRAARSFPLINNLSKYQSELVLASEDFVPRGRNCFTIGEMEFVRGCNTFTCKKKSENTGEDDWKFPKDLQLSQLGNLSSKDIIQEFGKVFADGSVYSNGKVLNLEVKLTFLEFFEAFIGCVENSIRLSQE